MKSPRRPRATKKKRERKKVVNPCPFCAAETTISVIYFGVHTRRCDRCRALSTLVRPAMPVVQAA